MNKRENTSAAQELDSASLDLVVGGGIAVPQATGGSETDLRKQEQSDKLRSEELSKQR